MKYTTVDHATPNLQKTRTYRVAFRNSTSGYRNDILALHALHLPPRSR